MSQQWVLLSHVSFLLESQIKTLTLSLSSKFHPSPQKMENKSPCRFQFAMFFFVFMLLHTDLPVRAIDLGDVLESPKTEELSAGRMLQWLHVGFLVLYLCWGRVGIIQNTLKSLEISKSTLIWRRTRFISSLLYMSMGFHTTFNSVVSDPSLKGAQDFEKPTSWESGLNDPVFFVDSARANLVVCVHPLRPPT